LAYQAKVIPIMIASPGDVYEEREVARDVIHTWNYINSVVTSAVLMPVGWETHSSPELGTRPQELINKRVLKDCDLLVGIFWTRIGTPTGTSESGTVEEIEKHIAEGKPAMLYFSSKPVAPQSLNAKQYEALTVFKKNCYERGLVEEFDNLANFKDKFSQQLQICLHNNPYLKSVLSSIAADHIALESNNPIKNMPPGTNLSTEAKILLKEASKDKRGIILKITVMEGRFIETNERSYGGGIGRESARWEYALKQLVEKGYVVARGSKDQVFEVTHEGFALADQLPNDIEA
jgi:hypothetical protein